MEDFHWATNRTYPAIRFRRFVKEFSTAAKRQPNPPDVEQFNEFGVSLRLSYVLSIKGPSQLRPFLHFTRWRELIRRTWGADPMECPCCHAEMKAKGKMMRREEIELFLRLHGLWEGITGLPPPPDPPYDIETIEPMDVPPVTLWVGDREPPLEIWWNCGSPLRTVYE